MGEARSGCGCDVIALSGFNKCSWSGPSPILIKARESGTDLALPPVVRLVALHRAFAFCVPASGGDAVKIVLANQSFLDFPAARGIDLLLTAA